MTNKKLALITCYFQPNYGSQLQAYATQLLFDKMKVENETIWINGLLSKNYWLLILKEMNIVTT